MWTYPAGASKAHTSCCPMVALLSLGSSISQLLGPSCLLALAHLSLLRAILAFHLPERFCRVPLRKVAAGRTYLAGNL